MTRGACRCKAQRGRGIYLDHEGTCIDCGKAWSPPLPRKTMEQHRAHMRTLLSVHARLDGADVGLTRSLIAEEILAAAQYLVKLENELCQSGGAS